MTPRFLFLLFVAAGAIGLFVLIATKSSPAPEGRKEVPQSTKASSSSSTKSPSSTKNPAPSLSSQNDRPRKNIASSGSPSSTVPVQQPQNSASLEKMEPWADKPSPHMKSLGEPAKARATVNDKSFDLVPNQLGIFQRVYVASRAEIAVKVDYPKASAGDPIIIQVQDGGQLDNGTVVQQGEIKDGNVAFHFRATENPGIHRVSLRKGSDVKTLDFWVGPPLPVRED